MASLIEPIQVACPVFNIGARGYEICLPGGACISGSIKEYVQSPQEICRDLLDKIQGILVPMAPMFDIVNAVLCIKDIIESIPDAIKSIDPSKVVEAINNCTGIIDKLLSLIPQVSMPQTLANMLDLIICIFDGFITELQLIIQKAAAIEALAVRVRGSNDPLFNIVECANRLNQNRMCNIAESMGPMAAIIELINLFLKLIGLDPIPSPAEMGATASAALEQFRTFINVLRQVRSLLAFPLTLPVPKC